VGADEKSRRRSVVQIPSPAQTKLARAGSSPGKPLFVGLPEKPFMSSYGVLSFLPHDRPLQTHFMARLQ